jgi:hypothetical protein
MENIRPTALSCWMNFIRTDFGQDVLLHLLIGETTDFIFFGNCPSSPRIKMRLWRDDVAMMVSAELFGRHSLRFITQVRLMGDLNDPESWAIDEDGDAQLYALKCGIRLMAAEWTKTEGMAARAIPDRAPVPIIGFVVERPIFPLCNDAFGEGAGTGSKKRSGPPPDRRN